MYFRKGDSMVVKNMKKRKLEDLSVDEFMNSGFDSDVTDGEEDVAPDRSPGSVQKIGKAKKIPGRHTLKDSLSNLKTKDPEFYEFLKEEDQKLLEFSDDDDSGGDENIDEGASSDEEGEEEEDELMKKLEAMDSDSDDEGDDDDIDDTMEPVKKGVHKPPARLEVAAHGESSDDETGDEDDESDDELAVSKAKKPKTKSSLVTRKMVQEWTKDLKASGSIKALRSLKKAFKAAVHQAGAGEGEINKYRVEGSKVFNAIVRACLEYVIPTLQKTLQLPKQLDDSEKLVLPSTSPKWRKIASDVKGYLTSVIELLSHMSDPAMVDVVLKHVHRLVLFFAVFPRLARIMLKRMIHLWGSAEETTRVLAFLCVIKLVQKLKDSMLEFCLKRMYLTYVKNCKFTSPSTLPMINFMQRSLVEVFALDVNLTYQYGFVYIRQLAIHLRNAVTVKKKENCQAVYNWQYVHCLHLWGRVVSTMHPNEVIQHLIYPLTETIIGTIKLMPTARYYPLRFHCVRMLNLISEATNTFIPVLPFLLEVFEQTNFNKKHKSISLKPFNFACILKLSKSQLVEKSFKDGVIDQLYELLLEHFHIHSHSIGFPELALPALLQLKDFLKKCKIANYCKQIKQIVEKVDQTSKTITQRRKSFNSRLSDKTAVEAWERRSKEEGTPISKFYTTWRKLRDRELQHEIAGKERLATEVDQFPEIIRRKGPARASEQERKEFSELFNSHSEDSDDETRFLLKEERGEPAQKKRKSSDQASKDSEDYSDFDSDELEQLAGSADDDSDEGEVDDGNGEGEDDDDDDVEEDDRQSDEVEDSDVSDREDVVKDFAFSSDDDVD